MSWRGFAMADTVSPDASCLTAEEVARELTSNKGRREVTQGIA